MSENKSSASSSKGELEQLSAIEESMASFGIGDLDSEHGVILKEWSAQDFANIYVRFRPHLISHARKFLREETQAEEVVQDAFLYLMTALPELDSELGVLRFLKWKTKMLCLDIIRSSQAGLNNNLVPLPEDVPDEAQPHDSLERADDAAIIRLALAKLNPRHREALIATMYEDKSHEEVAQQMGLGDNAFRQLLFRARASFRRLLVGEAEVEGKSVTEIISIAARKNAKASAGLIGGGSAFLLMIGLVSAPISPAPVQNNFASPPQVADSDLFVDPDTDSQVDSQDLVDLPKEDLTVVEDTALATEGLREADESDQLDYAASDADALPSQISVVEDEEVELASFRAGLTKTLDEGLAQEMAATAAAIQGDFLVDQQTIIIDSTRELTTYIAFDLTTEEVVQHVSLIYKAGVGEITAVPLNSAVTVERSDSGTYKVTYVATDFIFGDLGGSFGNVSVEDAPLRRSAIVVSLLLSSNGQVLEATQSLTPRT